MINTSFTAPSHRYTRRFAFRRVQIPLLVRLIYNEEPSCIIDLHSQQNYTLGNDQEPPPEPYLRTFDEVQTWGPRLYIFFEGKCGNHLVELSSHRLGDRCCASCGE